MIRLKLNFFYTKCQGGLLRRCTLVSVKVVLKAFGNNEFKVLDGTEIDLDGELSDFYGALASLRTKIFVKHLFGKFQKSSSAYKS